MVAELTKNERQGALIILLALAVTGLAMAAGGRGDPFGIHGALVLVTWIFASVALQVDGPSFLQSPRAEWLVTWLPLAIALQLWFERSGKCAAREGRHAV